MSDCICLNCGNLFGFNEVRNIVDRPAYNAPIEDWSHSPCCDDTNWDEVGTPELVKALKHWRDYTPENVDAIIQLLNDIEVG